MRAVHTGHAVGRSGRDAGLPLAGVAESSEGVIRRAYIAQQVRLGLCDHAGGIDPRVKTRVRPAYALGTARISPVQPSSTPAVLYCSLYLVGTGPSRSRLLARRSRFGARPATPSRDRTGARCAGAACRCAVARRCVTREAPKSHGPAWPKAKRAASGLFPFPQERGHHHRAPDGGGYSCTATYGRWRGGQPSSRVVRRARGRGALLCCGER